jgi:Ca2+-binding EF-hand superfamily protein
MRSDDVVREQAELQLKIDELRKRIQDYDNSPTSKIHAADLNEAMRMLGRKCTKKEIEDMIWEVDENLDGCVDWEEFKVRAIAVTLLLFLLVFLCVFFLVVGGTCTCNSSFY